jgi:hypothetical protein
MARRAGSQISTVSERRANAPISAVDQQCALPGSGANTAGTGVVVENAVSMTSTGGDLKIALSDSRKCRRPSTTASWATKVATLSSTPQGL